MRKVILCFLMIVFVTLNASQIVKITPTFLKDEISFLVQLDSQIKAGDVVVDKNASGSILSVYLKGVSSSTLYLPVAYGPVDSLRVFEIREGTLILIHMLIPAEPSIETLANSVKITIPISGKKVDLVLTAESTFETAVKFLADELGINVVVSDSVKNQKLSLKLQQISPEDALRNLLTTVKVQNEPLAYSYMPDGTLHIGTKSDIAFRFGKFWGIYDVTDKQILVEKLQSLISPATIMTYLPNKAVLFVYGDVQEQELISRIISLSPVLITEEITLTAPVENVVRMLDSLRKLYVFEYTVIEGLNKIVLRADSKVVERVKSYIREYQQAYKLQTISEEKQKEEKIPPATGIETKNWKVIYPQQAQAILRDFGLQIKDLGLGYIEVRGNTNDLLIAERVLQDLGFFSTEKLSLRSLTLPKSIGKVVLDFLDEIFGLKEPRILVLEEQDQITAVIFAPFEYVETVIDFTGKLTKLLAVEEKTEIFFLEDEQTAKLISEILGTIYGIKSVAVQSVLRVTGSVEQITKAQNFINFFVKERIVRLVEARFDDETFNEVRQFIEGKYKVSLSANLKILGKVMVTSQNLQELENAVLEIRRIYESVLQMREKSVRLVVSISNIDFQTIENFLQQLEDVKIAQTPSVYIITGNPNAVERAANLIEQLRHVIEERKSYLIFRLNRAINKEDLVRALEEFVQVRVLSVGNMLIIYGSESNLENAKLFISDVIKAAAEIGEQFVQAVRVIPYDGVTPTEELQEYLKTLGKNVEVKLFRTFELVSFIGTESDVIQAIEEYSRLSQKITEKLKLEEQPRFELEERVKIAILDGERFSVKCDDVELYEAISKIASALGKSIIYFDKPLEKITLDVRSIDWQNFIKMIEEEYGYHFAENQGVIALIKPKPVVDKTIEEKFVYTVPHNIENVKPIIEFYGGRVLVDSTKNLLIITGVDRSKREQIETLIKDFEKPTPQVEIEARFVEKSLLDELIRKYGLNLNISSPTGDVNLDFSSSGELNLSTSVIGLVDYRNLLSLLPNARVNLSTQISDGSDFNNLLASPRIVTSSGKEARILIGERIPYFYTAPDGTTVGPQFLDIGIELRLTPYVRSDGTIDLQIYTKVSEEKTRVNVPVPGESTREAQTRVIIKDGDTLIIGGLIRDKRIERISKVPVLGDLPFIGTFFRSKTENYEKQELMIFITARVIGL